MKKITILIVPHLLVTSFGSMAVAVTTTGLRTKTYARKCVIMPKKGVGKLH